MSVRAGDRTVPAQLLHSDALLDPLLTSMPSAAVVVNDEPRIVLVSDSFAERAGTPKESLIGRHEVAAGRLRADLYYRITVDGERRP